MPSPTQMNERGKQKNKHTVLHMHKRIGSRFLNQNIVPNYNNEFEKSQGNVQNIFQEAIKIDPSA